MKRFNPYGRRHFGQSASSGASSQASSQASVAASNAVGPGVQTSDFNHPVMQKLQKLQVQIATLQAANQARNAQLAIQEAALRQGTVPVTGPQDVLTNLRNILPDYLVPGDLNDVNRVVWPFWFTNSTPELPAAVGGTASQATGTVTITQEAAFIITAFMKSVFTLSGGVYTYVDPQQPGQSGLTPGLAMTIKDAQSSRVFMSNPIDFDTIGDGRFPQELPTPLMFLPNSIIQTQLFNASAVNYIPWITYIGVRCRIEDAQRIMSLVTG